MPNVTLALKKNGGAAVAGGITAAIGDVIQPTALDKAGWASNPAPQWQIWIYEGDEGDFSDYTANGDDPDMPTLVALGISDPPSFHLRFAGIYELRLVYGGGTIVSQAIIRVPYANGKNPIGPGETSEFGGAKRGAFKTINDNAATDGGVDVGLSLVLAKGNFLP